MPPGRLILASASPRRRELLHLLGLDFEVIAADVEELQEGSPDDVVVENALRKARAVAADRPAEDLIVGADTDVAIDGRLLGKAPDAATATAHLEALSGSRHEVLGGLALLTGSTQVTELVRTTVTFRELTGAEVASYVASEEWRDRAGAYAVQGLGASLVERVEGDLSNVIGLPIPTLSRMIASLQDL